MSVNWHASWSAGSVVTFLLDDGGRALCPRQVCWEAANARHRVPRRLVPVQREHLSYMNLSRTIQGLNASCPPNILRVWRDHNS